MSNAPSWSAQGDSQHKHEGFGDAVTCATVHGCAVVYPLTLSPKDHSFRLQSRLLLRDAYAIS